MNEKKDFPSSYVTVIMVVFLLVSSLGLGGYYLYSVQSLKSNEDIVIVKGEKNIKEQPINPEGMKIENLDKIVYGVIADSNEEEKIERLLPPPEEPIEIKKIKKEQLKKVNSLEKKSAIKKEKDTKVIESTINKKNTPLDTIWGVQLASVLTEKIAQLFYKNSVKNHLELKNTYLVVQNVTVKGKQYYRVRAMGFSSREDATIVCKIIKEKGGDCLVVK